MLLRPFTHVRAASIQEAVGFLSNREDTFLYAGGTELLLALKLRILRAERLIDIKRIPGLADIILIGGWLAIGASATHQQIADSVIVRAHLPVLASLCGRVANVRVRSVGTIGGNLCFGEPHADPPTLLAALGARLHLVGTEQEREIAADEFIRGEFETSRRDDELLTRIAIPLPAGPVTHRRFRHGERPAVNVAMAWTLSDDRHHILKSRIRVGALGPRPQQLEAVETALAGTAVSNAKQRILDVLPQALEELEVNEDRHGSAEYKRHLAGVLLLRNATESLGNTAEPGP